MDLTYDQIVVSQLVLIVLLQAFLRVLIVFDYLTALRDEWTIDE